MKRDNNKYKPLVTILFIALAYSMLLGRISINQLSKLCDEYEDTLSKSRDLIYTQQDLILDLEDKNKSLEKKVGELNSAIYFNENDIREASGVTKQDLHNMLVGTNLVGLEDTFLTIEQELGVNAVFMVSLAGLESNWGRSERALYQNNLTGYEVYNDSSKGRTFNSQEDCLYVTANLLSSEYLNDNGNYYTGYSVDSVNTYYCLDKDGSVNTNWSREIKIIAKELLNKTMKAQ